MKTTLDSSAIPYASKITMSDKRYERWRRKLTRRKRGMHTMWREARSLSKKQTMSRRDNRPSRCEESRAVGKATKSRCNMNARHCMMNRYEITLE